ncbi:Hypothetical protein FKW44_006134, partial [Caligus rogercresseyi]
MAGKKDETEIRRRNSGPYHNNIEDKMSAKDIVPENDPSPPEADSISNEENDPLTSTATPSGAAEEEEKCAHIEEEQTEPFDKTQNIVED